MLSHSQLKFLRSLQTGKFRAKEKQFLIEGEKLVKECLLKSFSAQFELLEVFALNDWMNKNINLIEKSNIKSTVITNRQLEQISIQKTPNQVIGLMRFAELAPPFYPAKDELYIATDKVQDPGNIGTIFRLAEWFGVRQVFLSLDSADPLNPKVIQSSMGSIFRVPYLRGSLSSMIEPLKDSMPIYGTMLQGEDLYNSQISSGGVIVLGNESKGISETTSKLITKPLQIPRFSKSLDYPESLNVATAAGIVLSEFKRYKPD